MPAIILVVLAAAGICAVFGVSSARAAATVCGDAGAPASGTYDALVVPAGEACVLDGLTIAVDRNLVLEPGAFLIAGGLEPSHLRIGGSVLVKAGASFIFDTTCECTGGPSSLAIGGNLVAANADAISVDSGTVNGSMQVVGGTLEVLLTNLSVGGNILVEGARGTLVMVGLDTVAGQVQVVNNRLAIGPGFGFNVVEGNTIGGNLICVGNNPPPFNQGLPNVVFGNALGQCIGL